MEEKIKKQRIAILKSMHELVCALNDENAYMSWIYTVPDGATAEDFEELAQDNKLYNDVCAKFNMIIRLYGDSGYYIFGDNYTHGERKEIHTGEKYRYIPEDCTHYARENWEFQQDINKHTALFYNPIDGYFISTKG